MVVSSDHSFLSVHSLQLVLAILLHHLVQVTREALLDQLGQGNQVNRLLLVVLEALVVLTILGGQVLLVVLVVQLQCGTYLVLPVILLYLVVQAVQVIPVDLLVLDLLVFHLLQDVQALRDGQMVQVALLVQHLLVELHMGTVVGTVLADLVLEVPVDLVVLKVLVRHQVLGFHHGLVDRAVRVVLGYRYNKNLPKLLRCFHAFREEFLLVHYILDREVFDSKSQQWYHVCVTVYVISRFWLNALNHLYPQV